MAMFTMQVCGAWVWVGGEAETETQVETERLYMSLNIHEISTSSIYLGYTVKPISLLGGNKDAWSRKTKAASRERRTRRADKTHYKASHAVGSLEWAGGCDINTWFITTKLEAGSSRAPEIRDGQQQPDFPMKAGSNPFKAGKSPITELKLFKCRDPLLSSLAFCFNSIASGCQHPFL